MHTCILWNFRIIETSEDNEQPRNVSNEEGISQGKKLKTYLMINGSYSLTSTVVGCHPCLG